MVEEINLNNQQSANGIEAMGDEQRDGLFEFASPAELTDTILATRGDASLLSTERAEKILELTQKLSDAQKEWAKDKDWKAIYEEIREREGFISDERTVEELNHLYLKGANRPNVALGLTGIDTEEAMMLRTAMKSKGLVDLFMVLSLAGVDSPLSWKIRKEIMKTSELPVVFSLAGLDTNRSWRVREYLLLNKKCTGDVIGGLAGNDSERAWKIREDYFNQDGLGHYIAQSLAGLDTERAWQMRDRLAIDKNNNHGLAQSLTSLDSEKSWQMREKLIAEGVDRSMIAETLAGLDSDRAWQMRERLYKEGVSSGAIAESLAGLNSKRAWDKREEFAKQDIKDYMVMSINGGQITAIAWRTRLRQLCKEEVEKRKSEVV